MPKYVGHFVVRLRTQGYFAIEAADKAEAIAKLDELEKILKQDGLSPDDLDPGAMDLIESDDAEVDDYWSEIEYKKLLEKQAKNPKASYGMPAPPLEDIETYKSV